jgi:hypothetical protein
LNKYLKGAGLVAWEAAEYIYSARTESIKFGLILSVLLVERGELQELYSRMK